MTTPTEGPPVAGRLTPTTRRGRPETAADVAAARADLTATRLERVGAGCYRVAFGSRRWVVKLERSYRSSVATIMAVQLATAVHALREGRRRPGRRVPGLAVEPGSPRGRIRALG